MVREKKGFPGRENKERVKCSARLLLRTEIDNLRNIPMIKDLFH